MGAAHVENMVYLPCNDRYNSYSYFTSSLQFLATILKHHIPNPLNFVSLCSSNIFVLLRVKDKCLAKWPGEPVSV